MRAVFVIALCVLWLLNPAQESKLIPVSKLNRDFNDAIAIIEAHPMPYRKISEERFQTMVDSAATLLQEPMDVISFFKILSPLYASLRDGHTSVRIAHHWMLSYYKRTGVFPYTIFMDHDNAMYIIQNYGPDSTIDIGAKILALNGVPVGDFLKEIDRYISYEVTTFRNTSIVEEFDLYLLLAFGECNAVSITYHAEGIDTHTVQFIPYQIRKKAQDDEQIRINQLIEKGRPYEYSLLTEGIGLLKIHSFGIANRDKFRLFLDNVFRKIQKDNAGSLIIDVRGNTGGAMYGVADLLHRLTTKPFKVSAFTEMKVSNAFRNYFKDFAPSVNFYRVLPLSVRHSFSVAELYRHDIGEFIVEQDIYKEPTKNIAYRFAGDLVLLTDGRSYSAAAGLAATFRCFQLGIIVGSPTGGTRIFHANNMYKELHSTDLYCTMATTRIYTPCFSSEDESIVPDIEVHPTVFHFMSGRDAALDYAVHLLKKAKKLRE